MANTIGIYIYKVWVAKRGVRAEMDLHSAELHSPVTTFVESFVDARSSVTDHKEIERSWHLSKHASKSKDTMQGYINYGSYGFESDLVNSKTMKKAYRRKSNDIEQIPLYYEFWFPAGESFGLLALQSFAARSCVGVFLSALKDDFEKLNPALFLRTTKLMPNSITGGMFDAAPVKKLRLISKSMPSDIASHYIGKNGDTDNLNFEVAISARRKGFLGPFRSLNEYLKKNRQSMIAFEGIKFDEAVAEIDVGGRRRRVGIFGVNSQAGVIDLTDSVVKGPDGHPTFQSMALEARKILLHFADFLRK